MELTSRRARSRHPDEQHNVGRFGVVGAHVFDLLRTVRERLFRAGLTPERRATVEQWFADRPQAARSKARYIAPLVH